MSKTEEIFRDNSFVGEIWSSVTWTTSKNTAGKQVCYLLSVSYYSERVYRNFGRKKQNDQASKEAKYFSMAFNSTPDVSHKDQTSQILHYVMIDEDKVKVVKSFVNFIETNGKGAENISIMILEKLEKGRNDIWNCTLPHLIVSHKHFLLAMCLHGNLICYVCFVLHKDYRYSVKSV